MKIIKRDKSIEDFEISKITRVVTAAGLSEEQARQLTTNISEWVDTLATDHIISEQLRERVCKELGEFNKSAANMYQWYEEIKYKK